MTDGRSRSRVLNWGLPVACYVALALWSLWPIVPVGSSRLMNADGNDLAPMVFFLAWLPHAIAHGLNPLFTTDLNYPYGVNLAFATSMPLLALLVSPITLLLGPISAYNFLTEAAFALSAISMYAVLRRYVRLPGAAFVGGLIYGFSPYMVGEGNNHPFLVFVPLPPILFAILVELVGRERYRPRRLGLLLGLTAGAQFLISAQVLADAGLLGGLGVVLVALRHPRLALQRARRVLTGLVVAIGPFLVLAGYTAWYLLFGPQRLTGSPEAIEIAALRADLLGPIIPTVNERVGPASWIAHGTILGGGDWIENGIYLGVPLLLLGCYLAFGARREAIVRVSALMALVAFVFALGSPLTINNHVTSIALPFALFPHLPILQDETALNYSLFVQLFAAIVVAVGLDRWWWRRVRRDERLGGLDPTRGWRVAGASLLAGAMLLPLVPRFPYSTKAPDVPSFFTTGLDSVIAPGSVVLTYPYPTWPYNYALLWQAQSRIRFKVLGSPLNTPQSPTDVGEGTPPLLDPSIVQILFAQSEFGRPATYPYGPAAGTGLAPQISPATDAAFRLFVSRYHVSAILLDPSVGDDAALVYEYLLSAFGRPIITGGMYVWLSPGGNS